MTEEKPYTKYLSQSRWVYARESDPEESLIIRNEYAGTVFTVFGICGVDKIGVLFDVLWKMLYVHKDDFVTNCKYAKHQLLDLTDKIVVWGKNWNSKRERRGRIECGVYLFPNEVMRLLYCIDARFMFGKFNGIVNHIDDDYFKK